MKFFGACSALLLLLALALFLPVLVGFAKTGLVERFPTLIVSGFAALAAVMSYFGGLILSVVTQQEKQDFEFKLNQVRHWKNNLNK